MNLVLIGYRGTGKSEVAKILADKTGRRVISTDAEIVRKVGMSIPEIVEKHGWAHFRDIESEVIEEVCANQEIIVDAGGGVIVRDRNTEVLRKNATVIWLKAKVETIADRIADDDQRPSLTGDKSFVDEISEVLEQRLPLYGAAAHHEIDTDPKTIEQVADEVMSLIK